MFRQSKNIGVKKNFENALKQSKGDLIFLADQDDIWGKNKVVVMKQCLAGVDLVISDCKVIDINERVVVDSFFSLRKSGWGIIKNISKNTYIGCCMAFKRKVLENACFLTLIY